MAAATKFNDFTAQLVSGTHNFASHTFKVMLTNTAPLATNSIKTDITEITAANGYTAGGTATTISLANASGTETISGTQVVFTATGAVGPFRYAVLYNSTATNGNLVMFWDYGSSISLANGETFTVKFNSATPGTITTVT